MKNADLFKMVFGIYATQMWAMSEEDFLEWLNTPFKNNKIMELMRGTIC